MKVQWGVPCVIITICIQVSLSYANPCKEVVKLYQSSLQLYQEAQKSYLKAGCIESPEDKALCKGLEAATRELQSTVEMFATRANLLKCSPQDAQKKTADSCERYRSLAKRSADKLKVLKAQYAEQRCFDRH